MKISNLTKNKIFLNLFIHIVMTSFLCQNFALAEIKYSCLAPSSFTKKAQIKREIYTALLRTRVMYAESDDAKKLLGANNANALLLSSGKYLVTKQVADDDLLLLRVIIHEDIEELLQIIAREDRYRYQGIKELILPLKEVLKTYYSLFPKEKKPDLPSDLLLNDIIAKAIELIFLLEEEMMLEEELSPKETAFVQAIRPIIMANRHNYFTLEFWNSSIRGEKIRTALNRGMRFSQTASTSENSLLDKSFLIARYKEGLTKGFGERTTNLPGEINLAQLDAKDFNGRRFKRIVGFTTFSGKKKGVEFEKRAVSAMEIYLEGLIREYGKENILIVCGATDFGGVHIVYNIAERLGLATMGMTADIALEKCSGNIRKCDYYYFERGDWGSESEHFIELIDELVAFGGGGQATKEIVAAIQKGKPVKTIVGIKDKTTGRAGGAADRAVIDRLKSLGDRDETQGILEIIRGNQVEFLNFAGIFHDYGYYEPIRIDGIENKKSPVIDARLFDGDSREALLACLTKEAQERIKERHKRNPGEKIKLGLSAVEKGREEEFFRLAGKDVGALRDFIEQERRKDQKDETIIINTLQVPWQYLMENAERYEKKKQDRLTELVKMQEDGIAWAVTLLMYAQQQRREGNDISLEEMMGLYHSGWLINFAGTQSEYDVLSRKPFISLSFMEKKKNWMCVKLVIEQLGWTEEFAGLLDKGKNLYEKEVPVEELDRQKLDVRVFLHEILTNRITMAAAIVHNQGWRKQKEEALNDPNNPFIGWGPERVRVTKEIQAIRTRKDMVKKLSRLLGVSEDEIDNRLTEEKFRAIKEAEIGMDITHPLYKSFTDLIADQPDRGTSLISANAIPLLALIGYLADVKQVGTFSELETNLREIIDNCQDETIMAAKLNHLVFLGGQIMLGARGMDTVSVLDEHGKVVRIQSPRSDFTFYENLSEQNKNINISTIIITARWLLEQIRGGGRKDERSKISNNLYVKNMVSKFIATVRDRARNCKDLDEEFVLAIDTEIGNLKDYATKLFEELSKLKDALAKEGLDNIRIFIGEGHDLERQLTTYLEEKGENRNFIISAVLKNGNLIERGLYKDIKDKLHITAVDDTHVPNTDSTKAFYIPIIPILELSIESAVGTPIEKIRQYYANLPNVNDIIGKNGILTIDFLPKPKPISIDELRENYMYESQVLSSA